MNVMKKVNRKTIATLICTIILSGCYGEKELEPKWEYGGPVPEITDGPAAAQKMCYDLYQKYEIHVYYNLEGSAVGQTPLGYIQTARIQSANPLALPFLAADDDTAEIFLKLLTGFYSLLPDDMVRHGLYRRQVLVMVNPAPTRIMDDEGNLYFSCAHTEDQIGIIVYGYLANNEDTENTLVLNPDGWKWNICHFFFMGHISELYKDDVGYPSDFGTISSGLYFYDNFTQPALMFYNSSSRIYNREIAKECGFVHPFGGINSWTGSTYADWGSFVAWIMTVPYEERAADIERWARIKTKYDIVMDYYRTRYNIDLETIGVGYRALTTE